MVSVAARADARVGVGIYKSEDSIFRRLEQSILLVVFHLFSTFVALELLQVVEVDERKWSHHCGYAKIWGIG